MNDLTKLRGCGTALVTPFNEDLSIDEEALALLVEFQINGGVDFLVPCGTTGESVTLSDEEQCRVVEIVQKAARGRVPVVAGAGGNNPRHVIKLAQEFERRGVDALLSVTPYYNKPTQEGLYQHYREISEATSLPIVVYNVPPRTAVNVQPDTLIRLSKISNIVGVKEASGDIGQVVEIAARIGPEFKIFSGDDLITLPVMAVGGAGLISVTSNEAPARMVQLTNACLNGDWEQARQMNRELLALIRANFIETSPGPVKAALAMMGRIKEFYRLPMVPVKPETRDRLREVLAELGLVEGRKSVEA